MFTKLRNRKVLLVEQPVAEQRCQQYVRADTERLHWRQLQAQEAARSGPDRWCFYWQLEILPFIDCGESCRKLIGRFSEGDRKFIEKCKCISPCSDGKCVFWRERLKKSMCAKNSTFVLRWLTCFLASALNRLGTWILIKVNDCRMASCGLV